jgi:hypothetical protein
MYWTSGKGKIRGYRSGGWVGGGGIGGTSSS